MPVPPPVLSKLDLMAAPLALGLSDGAASAGAGSLPWGMGAPQLHLLGGNTCGAGAVPMGADIFSFDPRSHFGMGGALAGGPGTRAGGFLAGFGVPGANTLGAGNLGGLGAGGLGAVGLGVGGLGAAGLAGAVGHGGLQDMLGASEAVPLGLRTPARHLTGARRGLAESYSEARTDRLGTMGPGGAAGLGPLPRAARGVAGRRTAQPSQPSQQMPSRAVMVDRQVQLLDARLRTLDSMFQKFGGG